MGLRKRLERKERQLNNFWVGQKLRGWMPIKGGSLVHLMPERPIFWGGFTRYIGQYPTPTRCGTVIYVLEKPTGPVTCLGCIAEGGA